MSLQVLSLVILQCSGKARETDATLGASTGFVQTGVIKYMGPSGRGARWATAQPSLAPTLEGVPSSLKHDTAQPHDLVWELK